MMPFLFKRALPFTLSFIFGAALSALAVLFGASGKKLEAPLVTRSYDVGNHCRMRRHNLVAESKSLNILNVPAAWWSWGHGVGQPTPVRVLVTFGADGTVNGVEQLDHFELPKEITESAKRAAWRIQFEPEKINGMPVSVKKEVKIDFMFE
jgi:hypothetical protein